MIIVALWLLVVRFVIRIVVRQFVSFVVGSLGTVVAALKDVASRGDLHSYISKDRYRLYIRNRELCKLLLKKKEKN